MLCQGRALLCKCEHGFPFRLTVCRTNSARLKQRIEIICDGGDSGSSVGGWKELPLLVIFERSTTSSVNSRIYL